MTLLFSKKPKYLLLKIPIFFTFMNDDVNDECEQACV